MPKNEQKPDPPQNGEQDSPEVETPIDLSTHLTRGKPVQKKDGKRIDLEATLTASEPLDDRSSQMEE